MSAAGSVSQLNGSAKYYLNNKKIPETPGLFLYLFI